MATKKIDNETRQRALRALCGEFYLAYSALVNAYLKAGEGLEDEGVIEEHLVEVSSVSARAEPNDFDSEMAPGLYVVKGENFFGGEATCGCQTLLEALEFKEAQTVVLQGKTIFIRSGELRNGEWYYVEQD
jgi:hypothetical protein